MIKDWFPHNRRELFSLKENVMEEKKKDSIYELDGTVPLKKALPLGIQHILAMFLGNVSPLIIVCGMLEMSVEKPSNHNRCCRRG